MANFHFRRTLSAGGAISHPRRLCVGCDVLSVSLIPQESSPVATIIYSNDKVVRRNYLKNILYGYRINPINKIAVKFWIIDD